MLFTIFVTQQYAAVEPVGSEVGVRNILAPVFAQVVDFVTAVVPLKVTVPEQAEPAVASCIATVLPVVEMLTFPVMPVEY